MSAHFAEWTEPTETRRMRVAGDFYGNDPSLWRVYASPTEYRGDYADSTLAWPETREEYERECQAAVKELARYIREWEEQNATN